MWFPRLPSERILRRRPVDGPFAVTLSEGNHEKIYCLNAAAEEAGLSRGMGLADARAYVPDLLTRPADRNADAVFLNTLARWATRYTPYAGLDGGDGLVLDISGVPHLFGGEHAMLEDMRIRAERAGLSLHAGFADTRGAAWAMAHFAPGIAAPGKTRHAIAGLPVEALRIEAKAVTALKRLGLNTVSDLSNLPRATLVRRFDMSLLEKLDQATGERGETVSPLAEPPHYGVRMMFPEPIGLLDDVMAALQRLTGRLCDRLKAHEVGVRILSLTMTRADSSAETCELRLARPMRDAIRIVKLFERNVAAIDAGFGIERMRLAASAVEPMPAEQLTSGGPAADEKLADLITRLGARIGLENLSRYCPAESHIPERTFATRPAADEPLLKPWPKPVRPRPLRLFPPEPVTADTARRPPSRFSWRRMRFVTARASGPERLAPEWWRNDPAWHSGLRDYWRVETREGLRLWMFHTPQAPGWHVHGLFA
ncbi:protein ImuB [Martelella mediterranea]|uniref:DNA-directed DNA polymerase n=2 Tax=Martelella mediterranea TaxID=293089 RepID=A0A4R3NWW5_9HYPH|nr:protein ImuB [Martelella mediterranea]